MIKYLLIIVFSSQSNTHLLKKLRASAQRKLYQRYATAFSVGRINLMKVNVVKIQNIAISLTKGNKKIDITIREARWRIHRWFYLDFTPDYLLIQTFNCTRNSTGTTAGVSPVAFTQNLALLISSLRRRMRRVFSLIPNELIIEEFFLDTSNKWRVPNLLMKNFRLMGGSYSAVITVPGVNFPLIDVSGEIGRRQGYLSVNSDRQIDQAGIFIGDVVFNGSYEQKTENLSVLSFNLSMRRSRFHVRSLCSEVIGLNTFDAHLQFSFQDDDFAIDESSYILYENLKFEVHAKLFGPDRTLKFDIKLASTPVGKVFDSISLMNLKRPACAAENGNVEFTSAMVTSLNNPFRHSFRAKLSANGVAIRELFRQDLEYIKYPFVYNTRVNGRANRKIWLDNSNTGFLPLERMPRHLVVAVTCTEDPNFYSHQGIDQYFFGFAIITNIVAGRFARGGSTITMQLVRNLFLDYDKTVFRKIEEIVTAYCLEVIFGVSKDRIMEVYLNIIEFAPNVFGIVEASHFYFSKPPAALTLEESLVLTYIIPRPKHFYDALMASTLQLKKNLHKHVKSYAAVLQRRGFSLTGSNKIDFSVRFAINPSFTYGDA